MKPYLFTAAFAATILLACQAKVDKPATDLQFDSSKGEPGSLTMHYGAVINYTAYTRLYFVSNVEDSTYQYMNIYVPEGATEQSPIFLRTNVGGYMASQAGQPQAGDASGRALAEGYVLVMPGSRGRNSTITADEAYAKAHQGVKAGQTIYTGRAPKGLLDLKAAIRYLRLFDKEIPGNTERIVTDGTSAGGAMSSLMGGTGNHPAYAEMLKAMGAADERDDVFAAVCYCPITDLDHADMAYEWLYKDTDSRKALSETKQALSAELAAQFPDYINSLGLKKADGTALTADNYLDYVKQILIRSAQEAKDAGADIADSLGFSFSSQGGFQAPINGGVGMGQRPQGAPDGAGPQGPQGMKPNGPQDAKGPQGMGPNGPQGEKGPQGMGPNGPQGMGPRGGGKRVGEYITDLDMPKYLNYVVSTQALKGVPSFDSYGVDGGSASGENGEFGDINGSDVNFTPWAAAKTGQALTEEIQQNVRLLNPMYFIGDAQTSVAPHWYIRHGARDRDTSFAISINLATKLQNTGKDVNFKLAWNRPHGGDYALNELFTWLKEIMK